MGSPAGVRVLSIRLNRDALVSALNPDAQQGRQDSNLQPPVLESDIFLRYGNDVYRTYFLQHGAMVQWIGSVWSVWSLTPYEGQSDDEELPEGWPRAPQSFWFRRHDEFDEPPTSASGGDSADD
jgi:hypothetical protein